MIGSVLWSRLGRREAAKAVAAILLDVEVGWIRLYPAAGLAEVAIRPADPVTEATIAMAGWCATRAANDVREAVRLVGEVGMREAADRALGLLAGRGPLLAAVVQAAMARDGEELDGTTVTAMVRAALA